MPDFFQKLLTFSLLLFTGFCFLKAGAGLVSDNSDLSPTEVEAAVPSRITEPRLQTTPIQKMRPGMRVLGRNPDRWDTQPVVEPDPVSWRLVSVRMEQQPGKFVLGQLLRPTSWIRHNDALPGAVIQLEIPEMHVAGDAEVLSIAECPPIRRGPGSVVTGTFQHVSDEVIRVFVEGESEPIGATSQHPFWSRDRNAFVPAGELRIGEELKTALGTSTRVTSIEIRAGPETVYGLEVAGEHVYQITNAGLLVHNASGKRSSLEQRIAQTPTGQFGDSKQALRGSWTAKRGRSTFIPADTPENADVLSILKEHGLKGVSYRSGKVNFAPFAKGVVRTSKVTSSRKNNFRIADELLAKQWDWTPKQVAEYRTSNNLTWHEFSDVKTLQLVPSRINSFFDHLGGVSEASLNGL